MKIYLKIFNSHWEAKSELKRMACIGEGIIFYNDMYIQIKTPYIERCYCKSVSSLSQSFVRGLTLSNITNIRLIEDISLMQILIQRIESPITRKLLILEYFQLESL